MEAVRFNESDVIVASGGLRKSASISLSGFSGGKSKDGAVQFNGTNYSMTSNDEVSTFLSALRNSGIRNAGISNGQTTQSLRNTLLYEVFNGARHWDGTFDYVPSAVWNNRTSDIFGVFIRQ